VAGDALELLARGVAVAQRHLGAAEPVGPVGQLALLGGMASTPAFTPRQSPARSAARTRQAACSSDIGVSPAALNQGLASGISRVAACQAIWPRA
jgi:hypothetical protein